MERRLLLISRHLGDEGDLGAQLLGLHLHAVDGEAAAHLVAVHGDDAAAQQVQEGRLAAPARAHDGYDFSRGCGTAQAFQDSRVFLGLADCLCRKLEANIRPSEIRFVAGSQVIQITDVSSRLLRSSNFDCRRWVIGFFGPSYQLARDF